MIRKSSKTFNTKELAYTDCTFPMMLSNTSNLASVRSSGLILFGVGLITFGFRAAVIGKTKSSPRSINQVTQCLRHIACIESKLIMLQTMLKAQLAMFSSKEPRKSSPIYTKTGDKGTSSVSYVVHTLWYALLLVGKCNRV